MKFRITFKSPDGVYESLVDAAESEADRRLCKGEVSPEKELFEEQKDEIYNFLKKFTEPWIKFSQYVTIEFDTETNTAIVLKG